MYWGYCAVLSCVRLFAVQWTVVRQVPFSMGFSRQEYWRGLPFPTSGALPDPGIKPTYPESPALAGRFFFITSELTNNVVRVSGEQQRDSAIWDVYIYTYTQRYRSILPSTPLPSTLPHNIEQSSTCYIVGRCWLSILKIAILHLTFNPSGFPFQITNKHFKKRQLSKKLLKKRELERRKE